MKKNIITMVILLFGMTSAYALESEKINIHGFIAQGYMQSSDNNFLADTKDGTFEFNETAINFSTRVTPKLHVGIQFFAHDLGDLGNDEIKVDWAFADYRWNSRLGLRVA